MYHPIKVEPLSKAQVSKLLKGQKVRVKKGSHHTLHVSEEQHKKLTKAHMKGAGITLQLDPYACDMNEHMVGEGIMSKLKGAASKALSIGKKALSVGKKIYEKVPDSFKKELKSQASSQFEKAVAKAAPTVEKKLGALGKSALSHVSEYGQKAIQDFGEVPEITSPVEAASAELALDDMHPDSQEAEMLGGALRRYHAKKGKGIKQVVKAIGRAAKKGFQAVAPALGGIAGSEFGPMGSLAGAAAAKALTGGRVHKAGPGHMRKHKTLGGALEAAGY